MNYTKNYHLPQWEETDRVMRTDFNQMCAGIDGGMAGNARAAEKLQETVEAQDRLLMRRMLRLAHNQYLTLRSMETAAVHPFMFYQNAVRDLPIETAGGRWDGARFVGTGMNIDLTSTFFTQYAKHTTSLRLDKKLPAADTPLQLEVCVPATTRAESLVLSGSYSENTPRRSAPFLLTLTNQDNGEVEQRYTLDLAQPAASGTIAHRIESFILYFHVGSRYLLKIEPIGDPVFSCDLHLAADQTTTIHGGGGGISSFDASCTIHGPDESTFGLLMLQCKGGGPDGKLTVTWDGKEMTPDYVRPFRNEQGLELREMFYFRQGAIPAESSFSVHFACGNQGSFWFQEWGAFVL